MDTVARSFGPVSETLAYVSIAVGVLQIFAILAGGGLVAIRLIVSTKLQEKFSAQTEASIAELKTEITALKALMTEVALQKAAIEQLRQWYDELRRGEGFIRPMRPRAREG